MRLIAIDGSDIALENTPELKAEFGCWKVETAYESRFTFGGFYRGNLFASCWLFLTLDSHYIFASNSSSSRTIFIKTSM